MPALLEGLRAASLQGLSAAALTVTVLDALACLVYGVNSAAPVYQLYGVTQLAVTLPVLARVLASRVDCDSSPARFCTPAGGA